MKSISKLFGRHFRSDYAVLRMLYIDDRIRTPHAFIRLQPTRGNLIVIGSRASGGDSSRRYGAPRDVTMGVSREMAFASGTIFVL